jgi:hypothetical protein
MRLKHRFGRMMNLLLPQPNSWKASFSLVSPRRFLPLFHCSPPASAHSVCLVGAENGRLPPDQNTRSNFGETAMRAVFLFRDVR